MKPNKQLAIGVLIAAFAFLAIAAFPPQWNSGQFRSAGGVFSHLPGGNLGTNQTLSGELIITNGSNAELELHSGSSGTSTIRAFRGGTELWDIFFNDTDLSIHKTGSGDAFLIESDLDVNLTGNFIFSTVGKGLQIKTGSNATAGTATLTAGIVTINTTAVTANSMIFITRRSFSGLAIGMVGVGTITAGTSFTIVSKDVDNNMVDDSSTVSWMIVEPAP